MNGIKGFAGVRHNLPVQIHRMARQTDTGLHGHPFHELVVITRGSGLHTTDADRYAIVRGDVFLIQPGTPHAYVNTEDLELINILYYPDRLDLPEHDLRGIPGYHAFFELEPALRERHGFKSRLRIDDDQLGRVDTLARLIEDELIGQRSGSGHMAAAYFMQLKGYVARCYTGGGEERVAASVYRIGELLSFMQTRYNEPVTLEKLAGMASMSVSTLNRTFQKVLGTSPMEHLIRIRIDRARELLRNGDVRVTDAAFMTGFTDSNYFSRMFKKLTGTSPRQVKSHNP